MMCIIKPFLARLIAILNQMLSENALAAYCRRLPNRFFENHSSDFAGTMGYVGTSYFVRKIYSTVKID